jgi:hypothetical protein
MGIAGCFLKQTNTHARKQQKSRRKTAQEQNTNGKHAECDHVEKKKATQNPLSIRKLIYEKSYTPEDGHVGRNM